MLSTILTKQTSVEGCVIQRTYGWLFENHPPQLATNPGFGSSIMVFAGQSLNFCVEDWFVFKRLVHEWYKERGATSSTSEMVLCYAYQSIIGMGEKVIPLILAQLKSEGDDPDQWFWALQVLTRANPVAEEDEGNFGKMARAWMNWAAEYGYAR